MEYPPIKIDMLTMRYGDNVALDSLVFAIKQEESFRFLCRRRQDEMSAPGYAAQTKIVVKAAGGAEAKD